MKPVMVCMPRGVPRQVGPTAGGDGHDHRLADGAGDPEHEGGDDAGQRRGTTTLVATWRLVLPRAYAPSRNEFGTADMASSDSEAMVGMIMMPMTSPADSAL